MILWLICVDSSICNMFISVDLCVSCLLGLFEPSEIHVAAKSLTSCGIPDDESEATTGEITLAILCRRVPSRHLPASRTYVTPNPSAKTQECKGDSTRLPRSDQEILRFFHGNADHMSGVVTFSDQYPHVPSTQCGHRAPT